MTGAILEQLDAYLQKNDYESAHAHLLHHLAEARAAGDRPRQLALTNELAGLCRKLSRREEALGYAEQALALVEDMGIEDNVGAATTAINVATVYKAFGMAAQAVPLFLRAERIYTARLAPLDARFGGLYNNMGLALVDLGQFARAREVYRRALAVMEQGEGREPEQAITYLNIASAAEAELGLEDGAEQIAAAAERAAGLLQACAHRRDGAYAYACEKCAPVLGYYGYFAQERALMARAESIYAGN